MTSPDAINLTVNVTKNCNTVCANCNRGIGVLDWHGVRDFTREDAQRTVDAVIATGTEVKKVKLSGGEPSLHPDIRGIVDVFLQISNTIWVISNAIRPRSELCELPQGAKWKLDHVNDKDHHPFFMSPTDLGMEDKMRPDLVNCRNRIIAGQGVEPEGFTQCGFARTLTRALGRKDEGIYFDKPTVEADMDYEICRHCPLSIGSKANKNLSLKVSQGLHKCPTKSFVGLHEPKKILVKADAHLRRLEARGKISYDHDTGEVVRLHQIEMMAK